MKYPATALSDLGSQRSSEAVSFDVSPTELHADPMHLEVSENDLGFTKSGITDQDVNVKKIRLSDADLERLSKLTVEQIGEMDLFLEQAADAFFANRISDCEAALRVRMSEDPLALCASGIIFFLRYILSMKQEHGDIALKLLTKASALASEVSFRDKSKNYSLVRVFQRMKNRRSSGLSAGDFRAKTIHANSQALRGLLLLSQQSVRALMKAGLAITRAYEGYKSLYTELKHTYQRNRRGREPTKSSVDNCSMEEEKDSVSIPFNSPEELADAQVRETSAPKGVRHDRNSAQCVELSFGIMNFVHFLLPSNAQVLLRLSGIRKNIKEGLALMLRCFHGNTFLSPVSGLLLLLQYGMLPEVSAFLVDSHLPIAQEVRTEALRRKNTRDSFLHLWLDARIERLMRNVEGSVAKMNYCLDVATSGQIMTSLPQFRDLALYDQWLNYAILHQWTRASRCLEILSLITGSSVACKYIQACCLEMLEIEWAGSIVNPDGEVDFSLKDLSRMVSSGDATDTSVMFCDLSTRSSTAESITKLYWEAAQCKPSTLDGKQNRRDQFLLKRMGEMLMQYGIVPSTVVGKKKAGEPLEPLPEGLVIRNIVPLPAYEQCLFAGLAHEYPAERKDQAIALIDENLLREQVEPYAALTDYVNSMPLRNGNKAGSKLFAASDATLSTSHKSLCTLPAGYRVLFLCVYKSMLLANSELKEERQAALDVIKAIDDTPQYKDHQSTLSCVEAFALYEKAYIAYRDGSPEAAAPIIHQLRRQYSSSQSYVYSHLSTKVDLATTWLEEKNSV